MLKEEQVINMPSVAVTRAASTSQYPQCRSYMGCLKVTAGGDQYADCGSYKGNLKVTAKDGKVINIPSEAAVRRAT